MFCGFLRITQERGTGIQTEGIKGDFLEEVRLLSNLMIIASLMYLKFSHST